MDSFALKGDIIYTPEPGKFRSHEDSYLVCGDGKVKGKWRELPERFSGIRVEDYSGKLIFPGLCDLHIHSPQYSFRGGSGWIWSSLGNFRERPACMCSLISQKTRKRFILEPRESEAFSGRLEVSRRDMSLTLLS